MHAVFNADSFFDRKAVMDAMSRADRRALSKTGAHIRRRARSSLRRRKRISNPGSPPSVHSTHKVKTLKAIYFHFEPKKRQVVVGPIKLGVSKFRPVKPGTTNPSTNEFGGQAWVKPNKWSDNLVKANYPARPFMGPSLQDEVNAGGVLNAWQDSFH